MMTLVLCSTCFFCRAPSLCHIVFAERKSQGRLSLVHYKFEGRGETIEEDRVKVLIKIWLFSFYFPAWSFCRYHSKSLSVCCVTSRHHPPPPPTHTPCVLTEPVHILRRYSYVHIYLKRI
jgi:hypothetical protein